MRERARQNPLHSMTSYLAIPSTNLVTAGSPNCVYVGVVAVPEARATPDGLSILIPSAEIMKDSGTLRALPLPKRVIE
jgi:hypothetical protein